MRLWTLFCALPLCVPLNADSLPAPEAWNWHAQATLLPEANGPFHAAYSGPASLQPIAEGRASFTATLYLGLRAWPGAQLYADPELSGGSGLSGTQGMAGVLNAETAHVGDPAPQVNLARFFVQQVFALGPGWDAVSSDQNQLAGALPSDRLTLLAGKFAISDYVDANRYAHDARSQFVNGALVASPSWDYPADTKGYTWGALAEARLGAWSLRAASALEPTEANGAILDKDWSKYQGDCAELEHRHQGAWGAGALRLMAYRNQADMGSYADALAADPVHPDILASRQPRVKFGFGLNAEQALGANAGAFLRLGWDDGQTESWAYTECDQTASLGFQLKGAAWGRGTDQWGLAVLANGLNQEHRAYLAAGGQGFLLGDGALNYGPEEVLETYYSAGLLDWLTISADLQGIQDPGYNRDRGPALVAGARLHVAL
jgi:carbohydrate-selective porin OprB